MKTTPPNPTTLPPQKDITGWALVRISTSVYIAAREQAHAGNKVLRASMVNEPPAIALRMLRRATLYHGFTEKADPENKRLRIFIMTDAVYERLRSDPLPTKSL